MKIRIYKYPNDSICLEFKMENGNITQGMPYKNIGDSLLEIINTDNRQIKDLLPELKDFLDSHCTNQEKDDLNEWFDNDINYLLKEIDEDHYDDVIESRYDFLDKIIKKYLYLINEDNFEPEEYELKISEDEYKELVKELYDANRNTNSLNIDTFLGMSIAKDGNVNEFELVKK